MRKSLLGLLTAAALTLSSNLFGSYGFYVQIDGIPGSSTIGSAPITVHITTPGTYANGKIVVTEKPISQSESIIEITNTTFTDIVSGTVVYTSNNEQLKETFKIGNSKGLARSYSVASASSSKR